MKTKKILAVVLAFVLCMGLTCTALAANEDTDPPMWQQWGYDSLEEYLTDWDETEEEYYDEVAWFVDYEKWPAWRAEYLAANPWYVSMIMAEDAKDPLWQWFGDESQEAFMEWWGEEGQTYTDVVVDWYLEDIFWEELDKIQNLRDREKMGGPAEGIGVMWMDEYVQFPDEQPTVRNERTMIPIRAFMECTGAVVDYADGVVYLSTPDGTEISFVIGEMTAKVVRGGATETIAMDVATYAENNRTFVPLRFFSQALGYDVFWDADYQTAVVIDADELIGSADANLKVLNGLMKSGSKYDMAKTYKSTGALTGSVKVNDGVSGWKSAKLSMDFSGLSRGMNTDMSMKWDLKDFIALILEMDGETLEAEDAAMLDALGKSDAQILLNADKGELYLQSGMIGQLATVLGGGALQIPANTWLKAAFDLTELAELAELDGLEELEELENVTLGSVLYMAASAEESIFICENFNEAAEAICGLLGDSCFTRTYDGYALNTAAIKAAAAEAELDAFDLRLNLKDSGAIDFSMKVEADGAKISMSVSGNQNKADVTMSLALENEVEISMTVSTATTETTETLRTAPDANALVLDLDALGITDMITESIPTDVSGLLF